MFDCFRSKLSRFLLCSQLSFNTIFNIALIPHELYAFSSYSPCIFTKGTNKGFVFIKTTSLLDAEHASLNRLDKHRERWPLPSAIHHHENPGFAEPF